MREDYTTIESIRATERNLGIDLPDDETLNEIHRAAGVPTTLESDSEEQEDMTLEDAQSLIEFRENKYFQRMVNLIETVVDEFTRKSEDLSATNDSRSSNHNYSLGVKTVLDRIRAEFQEADDRVANATSQEKLLLGRSAIRPAPAARNSYRDAVSEKAENDRKVAEFLANLGDSPTGPSQEVRDNTKRAIAYLESIDPKNRK